MKEIFARRNIKKYLDKIPDSEQIEKLLRVGMAAPSAGDSRDWSFLLIDSNEGREKFMKCHEYSGAVKTAPLLIIVYNRLSETFGIPERVVPKGAVVIKSEEKDGIFGKECNPY